MTKNLIKRKIKNKILQKLRTKNFQKLLIVQKVGSFLQSKTIYKRRHSYFWQKILLLAAKAAYGAKNYELTGKYLDVISESNEIQNNSLNFLAFFHETQGNFDQAIYFYKKALIEKCLLPISANRLFELVLKTRRTIAFKKFFFSYFHNSFFKNKNYTYVEAAIYIMGLSHFGLDKQVYAFNKKIKTKEKTGFFYYFVALTYVKNRKYVKADIFFKLALPGMTTNPSFADDYTYNLIAIDKTNEVLEMSAYFENRIGNNYSNAGKKYYYLLNKDFLSAAKSVTSRPIIKLTREAFPFPKLQCIKSKKLSKIVIAAEWGLGDLLFNALAFPTLQKYFDIIIIFVDERVLNIFSFSFPNILFKAYRNDPLTKPPVKFSFLKGKCNQEILNELEETDYFTWDTCLPEYFLKNIEDFKKCRKTNRLTPSSSLKTKWQKRLKKLDKKINIGITWRSSINSPRRGMHYLKLNDWAPIFKIKNVNIINLQYGDHNDELKSLKKLNGHQPVSWPDLDLTNDIDDIAALVSNLDLVVGPCNFVTELAGALGIETRYFVLHKSGLNRFGLFPNSEDLISPKIKIIDGSEEPSNSKVINMIEKSITDLINIKEHYNDKNSH